MKLSYLLVSAFLALVSGHYDEPQARYHEPPQNYVRSHRRTAPQVGPHVHETHERSKERPTDNLRNGALESRRRNSNRYDVIIVGSGIAGLSAAYELKYAGWSVKILEAKDRHGGRIYQNSDRFGIPIDTGAEWVHLEAKATGAGEFATPNDLLKAITEDDVPNSFRTKKDPEYVSTWSAGPPPTNEKSESESTDWRWVDTTWYNFMKTQIMDAENIEGDIMLDCPVTDIEIANSPDGLSQVWCTATDDDTDYQFEAYYVIVTIPMNMIQESLSEKENKLPGAITFWPEGLYDEYKIQADKYIMGPGIKVWLEFSQTFWQGLQALDFVETNHHKMNKNHKLYWGARLYFDEMYAHTTPDGQQKKHIIGMFSHGTGTAGNLKFDSDEKIIQDILSELSTIYEVDARSLYKQRYFIQHWSNEKYINTGYTQYAPWTAMDHFKKPVNNLLYFAGEAIPPDSNDWGYAHAAAQSGKSAGLRIIECGDSRRQKESVF